MTNNPLARGWPLALATLVGLSVSCAAGAASPSVFVYCSEGSPTTFNPQMGSDGATFNASSRTVYSRLVEFERGGTRIVPGLAKSWTFGKDGTSLTLKLRPGVKFHETAYFKPTRDFDSSDVVFTFGRFLREDHPFHKINGGVYEYFKSMELDTLIKNVVAVDPLTVRFELAHVEAPFLADLAMDFASITSAEYGASLVKNKTLEKFDMEPVGTGPFIFRKYEKDSLIRYDANPNYYEGRPASDKLVFAITTDPNVRYQKLKRGECQLIAEPPQADLKDMRADKNLKVMEEDGLNVGYMAINVAKTPLQNKLARQAIAMALDKPSYIDAVYLNDAVPAKNPIPPTMWSFDKSIKDYEFDPAKARALLAKAGYAGGFDVSLWWPPLSRPYLPNGKRLGEMMQADLAKAGIRVRLESFDWAAYLDKTRKGEHSLALFGWVGDNGDPDNFLNNLLSCGAISGGSNLSLWCDKNFDKAVLAAKKTTDQKKRAALYREAQRIFHEEVPFIPIANAKAFRAMRADVDGYRMSPFGLDDFFAVSLKPSGSKR